MTIKTQKAKQSFADKHAHNILTLLDIFLSFSFPASEIKRDYQ